MPKKTQTKRATTKAKSVPPRKAIAKKEQPTLEQRVAELEQELGTLKGLLQRPTETTHGTRKREGEKPLSPNGIKRAKVEKITDTESHERLEIHQVPPLRQGAKVPHIAAKNHLGDTWAFAEHEHAAAKLLVLFFLYDLEDEAAAVTRTFNDTVEGFARLDAEPIGIYVGEDADKLAEFAKANHVQLTLLQDPDRVIGQLFGVWKAGPHRGHKQKGAASRVIVLDRGAVRRSLKTPRTATASQCVQALKCVEDIDAVDKPQEIPHLEAGDVAPPFKGVDDWGRVVSCASDFAGEDLLLLFFPEHYTDAAEKQATEMASDFDAFAGIDVQIIGISPQSPERLRELRERHGIKFTLIADDEHAIANAYGAWRERTVYGSRRWGVERMCFFIDDKGVLRRVYNVGKVEGFADKLLNDVQELKEMKAPTFHAEIKAGDRAPRFAHDDIEGSRVKLGAFSGKSVVLFFCPKTSGDAFAAEAEELEDARERFAKLSAEVLVVCPESREELRHVKESLGLSFVKLLPDPDFELAYKYGVREELRSFGRKYWGIARKTFVIGPQHEVISVLQRSGRVRGHVEHILDALDTAKTQ